VRVVVWMAIAAALAAAAGEGRVVKLELPRALRAGETLTLEVRTGKLARGDEVVIRTPEGRLLGTISPFGRRAAAAGSTYTVPVPVDALSAGKLTLHLTIKDRAPTAGEVKSVKLKVRPPALRYHG
jgi:hypothetical protein